MFIEYLGNIKNDSLLKQSFLDPKIYKRAKHVVSENQRVLKAKTFMVKNNIKKFGELMNFSHASYSKDFEASNDDVDLLVQRSLKCGAAGSRLTGGGFGGFTVSLIEKEYLESWYNKMLNYYNFLVRLYSEMYQEQKNKFQKLASSEIDISNIKTG